MREILFRGKTPYGRWIEGSLVCKTDSLYGFKSYAIVTQECDKNGLLNPTQTWYPVKPDTVGQYTGLTDKNGKRIFEGDIVDLCDNWWNTAGPAGHESPIVEVCWNGGYAGFDPFADYDCDCGVYTEASKCKVIGNIHDNPELLEGTNNDKAQN